MRYLNIGTEIFTNSDGESKSLKKIRPPVVSDKVFIIEDEVDYLDGIAVRAYGDNAEPLWYHIADQNWKNIVEKYFELLKIRKLEIPIL